MINFFAKKSLYIFIFVLAAIALLFSVISGGAGAASFIFINNENGIFSGRISSAYAIGGSGKVELVASDKAYVMTGGGLTAMGKSPAEIPVPARLDVSGSISVGNKMVKVGLCYDYSKARDTSLSTANLQNCVGEGYLFGYYDSKREFRQVGYTGETKLTMIKDTNMDTVGGRVGCYHILLPSTYASFEEALAAASQYPDGFPAYYNGTYYALVGNYDSMAATAADMSARGISGNVYSASNRCIVVTRTSDAKILFEFDGGTSANLAVRPQTQNGEKAETWFKGFKYYGDFEYIRMNGTTMTVVNIVPVEDYVKGVVPHEMSASWPLEALKAQAVCARTYAAANMYSYSDYGFDVTNDTYSQVYRGCDDATANSDRAVDETAGVYVTYNGKLTSTLYFSSDGGGTEDSENVFSSIVPYLRGKADPFEDAVTDKNSHSEWKSSFTGSQLSQILRSVGYALSDITAVDVTYSDYGNAVAIKLTDVNGKSVSFNKNNCYNFSCGTSRLGLPSIHYYAYKENDAFVFEGGGWGHNIGMSQYGAYSMAQCYNYTYDQIISFYYTGVTLAQGVYSS